MLPTLLKGLSDEQLEDQIAEYIHTQRVRNAVYERAARIEHTAMDDKFMNLVGVLNRAELMEVLLETEVLSKTRTRQIRTQLRKRMKVAKTIQVGDCIQEKDKADAPKLHVTSITAFGEIEAEDERGVPYCGPAECFIRVTEPDTRRTPRLTTERTMSHYMGIRDVCNPCWGKGIREGCAHHLPGSSEVRADPVFGETVSRTSDGF